MYNQVTERNGLTLVQGRMFVVQWLHSAGVWGEKQKNKENNKTAGILGWESMKNLQSRSAHCQSQGSFTLILMCFVWAEHCQIKELRATQVLEGGEDPQGTSETDTGV